MPVGEVSIYLTVMAQVIHNGLSVGIGRFIVPVYADPDDRTQLYPGKDDTRQVLVQSLVLTNESRELQY